MVRPPLPLLLFALLLWSGAARAEVPRVVVSLQPIHSLVAGVMEGVGAPDLLIDGAQSPHTFTLRPSDARKLNRAGLVVWVGEALETPLARTIAGLPRGARVMELMTWPGIERLPAREGGAWERHGHDEEPEHEEHREHAEHAGHDRHLDYDPHLWLSPENAARIAEAAAGMLADMDPEHAERYRQNTQRLLARLERMDRSIAARLAPLRDRPYLVSHDAYHPFERHYRLNPVGSVTVSPERAPGARRVHELRTKIRELGARCVFSEPQFPPRLVETLVAGSDARTGMLDPLGIDIPAGPEAYFTLMERLATSLEACLGEP